MAPECSLIDPPPCFALEGLAVHADGCACSEARIARALGEDRRDAVARALEDRLWWPVAGLRQVPELLASGYYIGGEGLTVADAAALIGALRR